MAEGKGHTELPWRVTKDARGEIIRTCDGTGKPIASMWLNGDDAESNANLIVTAVNTYPAVDGLVKALEAFTRATLTPTGQVIGLMREDFENAKSALSRFRSLQNGGAND